MREGRDACGYKLRYRFGWTRFFSALRLYLLFNFRKRVSFVALAFFSSLEGIVDKSDEERKGRRKVLLYVSNPLGHESSYRSPCSDLKSG